MQYHIFIKQIGLPIEHCTVITYSNSETTKVSYPIDEFTCTVPVHDCLGGEGGGGVFVQYQYMTV